jgi:hypothetical protein
MKIEIRKETKANGDVFFKAYEDATTYVDCVFQSKNQSDDDCIAELEQKLKSRIIENIEKIKTIEI